MQLKNEPQKIKYKFKQLAKSLLKFENIFLKKSYKSKACYLKSKYTLFNNKIDLKVIISSKTERTVIILG